MRRQGSGILDRVVVFYSTSKHDHHTPTQPPLSPTPGDLRMGTGHKRLLFPLESGAVDPAYDV